MKCRLIILLSLIIAVSSCERASPYDDRSMVEITLEHGNDVESISDAEVFIYYADSKGQAHKKALVCETSDNRYAATIPSGSTSATPFIEVSLNGISYDYSIETTCFKERYKYRYWLILEKDGLHRPDSGITVEDWNTVDVNISL